MPLSHLYLKNLLKSDHFGLGSLFNQLDYYSKDLYSHYLDCSQSIAKQLNLVSTRDINGQNDASFGWSKERVKFLREHDLHVISKKAIVCKLEDPWTLDGKPIQLLSYKVPLLLDNKVVGISGVSINVANINLNLKAQQPDLVSSLRKVFSNRESQVIYHLVHGKSAKEIAALLGLKKRTVEFYLTNIKNKANVSSKSALIEKVIEGFI